MKNVVTIAGSDCSGGAGIQADIKTITMQGLYAQSIITALTAQNTTGVMGIENTSAKFVKLQFDAVFSDIYPDAVKIGMVSNAEIINCIVEKLNEYKAKNIVVDPVMISTSGSRLIDKDCMATLISKLLPLATVITPNIPEAEMLSNLKIQSAEDMEKSAKIIHSMTGTAVLIKGGHSINDASDCLCTADGIQWFQSKRIDNPNTHGTGCTLSSCIACGLAQGKSVADSVATAKEYITGALNAQLDLGKGSGPLMHNYSII